MITVRPRDCVNAEVQMGLECGMFGQLCVSEMADV